MTFLKTYCCFIAIHPEHFIVSFPNGSNTTYSDFYELHKFISTQSVCPCSEQDFNKSFETNLKN